MLTPLAAVGLVCVLAARKYTLKRNVVRAGDPKPGSSESDSGKVDIAEDEEKPQMELQNGKEEGTV